MSSSVGFVFGQLLVSWIILLKIVAGKVIIDPPAVHRPDGDLVVDVGSTFTLSCRGDSPLAWAYNDYKNEESKSKKEVKSGTEQGQKVSKLTVSNAFYLDTGYFTCYPLREGRSSPQAQKIYVYVKDPVRYLAVNDSLMIITVYQYENALIPCKPTDPDHHVELMKDGDVIPDARYDPHVGFEFYVNKVHQAGEYSCVINEHDALDFLVNVEIVANKSAVERPHISISPTPVVKGVEVTFDCQVHYDVGVTIHLRWEIPQHLNQSKRIHEHEDKEEEKVGEHVKNYKGHRILTLIDVSKQDEGEYTCHVVDNVGNRNSKSVKLTVQSDLEKPIIHTNGSTKFSVSTGDPVNLYCYVQGSPSTTITWFMNDEIITKENDRHIELLENNQTLSIGGAGLEHKGRYVCHASNKAGTDKQEFDIDVIPDTINWFLWCIPLIVIVLMIAAVLFYWHYVRTNKRKIKENKEVGLVELEYFERGKIEPVTPDIDISEQADLLTYDRQKWEFPQDKAFPIRASRI